MGRKKNRGIFLGREKSTKGFFGYAKKRSDFNFFWINKF